MWRVRDLIENEIRGITKHNPKGCPHLPLHDKAATNSWRSGLCGIDGNCSRLGTDTESKAETSNEHVPPSVCEPLPKACHGGDAAGKEDGTTSAEPIVEWDGQPASDKSTAEIGSSISKAKQPGRARIFAGNTELF